MTRWFPDALCVFGRGIEQVSVGGRLIWHPTRYVERLNSRNWHSGLRNHKISAQDEDEQVVIAGANANVIAAAHFFKEAVEAGNSPRLIVFAAGRPSYLDEAPREVNEGEALKKVFLRRAGDLHGAQTVVQARNRNTRDDLLEAGSLATILGYTTLGIVTVAAHIDRSREFLDLARQTDSRLRDLEVRFMSAESLLADRHPRYARLFRKALNSPAMFRTMKRERRGIRALREGSYEFAPQREEKKAT